MRLALANVLALVAFIGVLWFCFAFIAGFASNAAAPLGFTVKFGSEEFGFAMIYMMFIGPFALVAMLIYFGLFRARPRAVAVLAMAAVLLSVAFMTPVMDYAPFPGSGGNTALNIMIVWSGVLATLAHHIVFGIVRPRGEHLQSVTA